MAISWTSKNNSTKIASTISNKKKNLEIGSFITKQCPHGESYKRPGIIEDIVCGRYMVLFCTSSSSGPQGYVRKTKEIDGVIITFSGSVEFVAYKDINKYNIKAKDLKKK